METRFEPSVSTSDLKMAAARRAVAEALLPRAMDVADAADAPGGWRALAIAAWMAAVAMAALVYEFTWHVVAN